MAFALVYRTRVELHDLAGALSPKTQLLSISATPCPASKTCSPVFSTRERDLLIYHTLDNISRSIDSRKDPIPIGGLLLLVIGIDWHFLKLIVAGNRYRLTPSLIYCSAIPYCHAIS